MFRSMELGEEGFSIWSITGLIGAQMAAKAAIELNVFNIINEAGPEAQLSSAEIVSKIPTTNHKAAAIALDKILAMLTTKSILSSALRLRPDHKQERIYGLTMASRTLVTNGGGVSIAPLVLFACEKEFVDSLYMAKETVLEPGCSPFRKAHGSDLFEYLAKNPRLSRMFNEEMECFSKILLHKVLKVYSGFQEVKELMDVGGGNGATLEKIVSIYPHVKGINFDLPHVIADAAISCPGVEHIAGDMFDSLPNAQTILLKSILHDWDDDRCIMLLRKCWQALPEDGKVIALEFGAACGNGVESELAVATDFFMMVLNVGGKERTVAELEDLAKAAGFGETLVFCIDKEIQLMEFIKKN